MHGLDTLHKLPPTLFVLDEPSTGLAATDTVHLARALARLARRGHAVVVIEHDTDLLEVCDRLVELGPGGGVHGGRVVATGAPRDLTAETRSVTGRWLFRRPAPSAHEATATEQTSRGSAARRRKGVKP